MSKRISFDLKHYGINGTIPLRIGDSWRLDGTVQLRQLDVLTPYDLTGSSCTGFFQATDGTLVVADSVTVTQAVCGRVEIALSATGNANVALANNTSLYLTVQNTEGLFTVEMENPDLEIAARGFTQF